MQRPRFTLATLQTSTGPQAAIGVKDAYYPIAALPSGFEDTTIKALLQEWESAFPKLQTLATDITRGRLPGTLSIGQADAELLTPIRYPDKLLAVGANYVGHLKEMGLPAEKWNSMPFFMRPPTTSLVGPGDTVSIPKSTKQFDWECELAVVVGKKIRHASVKEAAEAIAGYTVGLDLSCRDLIPAPNELKIDLMRGKAQDTMAPCGPHIVPAQFLPDVGNLNITLSVNGRSMMDASTNQMLYKCNEQLSIISEYMTLVPGDIVFTGSPSGSAGVHGNCWLKAGDRIHAEISGVGVLEIGIRSE